ncbi:MAG: phosphoribosylformylglycinamidine synthase, partial [Gammaproteobacteria bacterium]
AICARERCPYAVIGVATQEARLVVEGGGGDSPAGLPLVDLPPIDLPLSLLLGDPPLAVRDVTRTRLAPYGDTARSVRKQPRWLEDLDLAEAAHRVLTLPAVADKTFLITIGDRTVSGLVCRDQMVGPDQVPVADCAVTTSSLEGFSGEAMAMGERTPLALLDAPASGRMAVAEALLNLAAAPVESLSSVALSANWMGACGHPGEDALLYETVRAVAMALCPELGISIPVGKDSLSMKTVWHSGESERAVISPVSLIVTAFAPVADVRRCLTPELDTRSLDTRLLLVDLGAGRNRLGGSALAQVYGSPVEGTPADLESATALRACFETVQRLNAEGRLLAYHDRSDGGLFITLIEMAFAAPTGLSIDLGRLHDSADRASVAAALFAEEPGIVIQVAAANVRTVIDAFESCAALEGHVHDIGAPSADLAILIRSGKSTVYEAPLRGLRESWSRLSLHMRKLRDDPDCAREEFESATNMGTPALQASLSFDPHAPMPTFSSARPRVAILREQGVNGYVEMAGAFHAAGFEPVDVHMSDLKCGRATLEEFAGLAAGGGFSYGDVLGGGGGWAAAIRYDARTRDAFAAFFERSDTFALGVCNGCQMLARLSDLIPGARLWPRFERNRSEQFEARLSLVEILPSPSLFLSDIAGSVLPVAIAHGEGHARFRDEAAFEDALQSELICLRYAMSPGTPAQRYPANPNGSRLGATGFTTPDGRFTIMMPHPERVYRNIQLSWRPPAWRPEAHSPWLRMFSNARAWLG